MSASSPKTWNKLTAASPPITTRACWRASITSTSRPSTLRSLLWNQPLTHAGAPPRRLGPITPPVDVCPSPQTCRPVYAFPPHLDLDWKPSADRKPIGLSQARPRRVCAEKSSTALAASFQPTARRYAGSHQELRLRCRAAAPARPSSNALRHRVSQAAARHSGSGPWLGKFSLSTARLTVPLRDHR